MSRATDRPMLFSAPMIQALLDGRKSQTRRLMTRNNCTVLGDRWGRNAPWEGLRFAEGFVREKSPISGVRDVHLAVPFCHSDDEPTPSNECGIYRVRPEIEPGDRIWVREAWRTECDYYNDLSPAEMGGEETILFEADADWSMNKSTGRRRQAIHMPRWASRLTLIVTDVRVQRLTEISEEDARAEGAGLYVPGHGFITQDELRADPGYSNFISPRMGFEAIWTSINGPGSWDANPWVAAISFTVHRANIDALAKEDAA